MSRYQHVSIIQQLICKPQSAHLPLVMLTSTMIKDTMNVKWLTIWWNELVIKFLSKYWVSCMQLIDRGLIDSFHYIITRSHLKYGDKMLSWRRLGAYFIVIFAYFTHFIAATTAFCHSTSSGAIQKHCHICKYIHDLLV